MDCCHILLDRTWQFDRHIIYDRRVNTYTTGKDGVTYTLFPLIEAPDEMSCTMRVCMVSGKEFEKDMKKNPICFAIIPRRPSSSSDDRVIEANVSRVTNSDDRVQIEIKRLLEEYKEIISEKIPDGLPPIRSINHCMDLIPRESFPNKAPYRLH